MLAIEYVITLSEMLGIWAFCLLVAAFILMFVIAGLQMLILFLKDKAERIFGRKAVTNADNAQEDD